MSARRWDCPRRRATEVSARSFDAANAAVSADCYDLGQAEQILNGELTQHGLTGWTVIPSPSPFDDQRPCASLSIDPATRTVTIVPEGKPISP